VAEPSNSGTLVLRLNSLPANQRIYKQISKVGQVIPCEPPKDMALAKWASDHARTAHQVTLPADAAKLLVELVGNDLGRLDTEIAKLALFADAGRVTADKVHTAVAFQREQEVRDIVKFLEYVLNTLGSGESSARDKDVLVTESYTKIFRDGKVQVEDDLVEKRNVITNKDVQAYLKDVDFFFQDVKFEFTIKEIKGNVNANGKLFYKVSLVRNMRGTNMDGKAVNSTLPRFIEINYDQNAKDLKIVSIYTKEFDERTSLLAWWNSLSSDWQALFKKRINLATDSMDITDIQTVMDVESMDLSQNHLVQSIEPLTALINLQVLNISHTSITDLSPLRNLTGLVELNASNTPVGDATSLRYSDNYDLSRARALEVTNRLKARVRDPARVDFTGKGSSEPRYRPENSPENRARNRRVEILHRRGG